MYEDPEEATLRAVDICIEQGVLVDILRKRKLVAGRASPAIAR